MSAFWKELFELQGSQLKASYSYHPQTDGQTVVTNRTLEQYLRCFFHEEQGKWRELLPWAEYWYNTSHHSSLNTSPFEIMYGRPPPTLHPYDVGVAQNEEVEREMKAREEALSKAKRKLEKAQERMKKRYDERRREEMFEPGEYVYLKLQPYRQRTIRG